MIGPALQAAALVTGATKLHLATAQAAETIARPPIEHGARQREHTGLEGRPGGRSATQIDALRGLERHAVRLDREPRDVVAQAQENRGARATAQITAGRRGELSSRIGERFAFAGQHDHPRRRPQSEQCLGVVAQAIGAIERIAREGETGQRGGIGNPGGAHGVSVLTC